MTRLIQNLLVVAIAVLTSRATQAEDLFSEITIGSVFAEVRTKQGESLSNSATGRRLSGLVSLKRMLTEADFRPQDLGNDGVLVVLQAPGTKDGVLNVAIGVHLAKGRIVISAPLVKIVQAESTLQDLLKLLNRSRSNSGIYFTAADQTVSIRRTLDNDGVSADWLKAQIEELVDHANANAAAWQALGKTMAQLETESREAAPTDVKKDISLVGRWSAEGSKGESYGFVFTADRYQLAIVASGQVHRSDGTWTLRSDRLTLAGDATNLSGTVMLLSDDRLVLSFEKQKALTFTKK